MRDGDNTCQRVHYARCPGCGDMGDVSHVVACVGLSMSRRATWDATVYRSGVESGAIGLLFIVEKQMNRRGRIDWDTLTKAALALGRCK